MRSCALDYNAADIWVAINNDTEKPAIEKFEATKHYLLWRFDMRGYHLLIDEKQRWMLDAIKKGKNFAQICEGLCAFMPEEEVAAFAAGQLNIWITDKVVAEFTVNAPSD